MPSCRSICRASAVAVLLVSWSGCSAQDGPRRYEVSGQITLNGKPAPVGEIYFEPDASQGNAGPGAVARIVNSSFRTPKGKGVTAGPHVVNIVASDGVPNQSSMDGKPLTTKIYVTKTTIPQEDSVQNFDVPASHLVNK
jgi:hypothetical protein